MIGPFLATAKKRYPRVEALQVARELCAELSGSCKLIKVAGSLRRGKVEVGDVEIVYVPLFRDQPSGLFDRELVNVTDEAINRLMEKGVLSMRTNAAGHTTWGEKNKLAVHCASGMPVDFFATSQKNWFMTLVIRTGPKELNLRLIEAARKKGIRLHAYGVFEDSQGGEIVPNSEREVFEIAGVPYLEPEERG